ncbi:MAG TPA: YicC family protein [Hellea balneolensis]|uniref:YicC family protein n=1 Tax=Hellea balneolensis TaxID=287478 RepID=A0A7C5R349_9PROT|nr:YicC family protein [Hellea balneolensis]
MSLNSMTGYGRAEGAFEDWTWVWEVRSVNGKSLDMRLRLPQGFESLDPQIRKLIGKALVRGNLQVALMVQSTSSQGQFSIDNDWLEDLVRNGEKLVTSGTVAPARLDGLYLVRGVVQEGMQSASDPALEPRNKAILRSLGDMLKRLKKARKSEGQALAKVMSKLLTSIAKELHKAKNLNAVTPAAIHQKFSEKLNDLLAEDLPEDKLAQEAALLAVRADVREELDRLDAHIAQANTLLKKGSPVGRKLDFLSQEFIREINTMCSKSTDIELTRIGLEMKSLIEQFREQAANVE